MAKALQTDQKKARIVFILSWFLIIFNVTGIVWSIGVRFYFTYVQNDTFFTTYFRERLNEFYWISVLFNVWIALSLVQIFMWHKTLNWIQEDTRDSQAAEASVKLARMTAFAAGVLALLAFAYTFKIWRNLYEVGRQYNFL